MQIRVSYATQIRQITGITGESLALEEGLTLQAMVEILCEKHGEALRQALVDDAGAIRRSLILCINDKHIAEPAEVKLTEGDELLIMPAISGG